MRNAPSASGAGAVGARAMKTAHSLGDLQAWMQGEMTRSRMSGDALDREGRAAVARE